MDEIRLLWRKAREIFKATIIQQTFLDIAEPIFGNYDRLVPGAPKQVIAKLNDQLSEAAAEDAVTLLDVARASERDGIDTWFDVGHWLYGKMEIAPQSAALYGDMVSRIVGAQQGLSKKCLVFDLDNTLWGGVVGDDGPEEIVLGEGSARGEAHLALQRYAKQLKERGVILAVCSKNDPVIAEAVFRDHPEMHLKRSDIAVFIANWEDKSKNLADKWSNQMGAELVRIHEAENPYRSGERHKMTEQELLRWILQPRRKQSRIMKRIQFQMTSAESVEVLNWVDSASTLMSITIASSGGACSDCALSAYGLQNGYFAPQRRTIRRAIPAKGDRFNEPMTTEIFPGMWVPFALALVISSNENAIWFPVR